MLQFFSSMVACPVCKSPVTFQSGNNNMKVCSICNTALKRLEGLDEARTMGIHVVKKNDHSIIQIGTRGKFENKKFEVTGCLHCEFSKYDSKRWTVYFDKGKNGLLTETAGFYAIQEKIISDFPTKLSTVKYLQVGTESIELIKGNKWYVFDKDKCDRSHLEGEILLPDDDGLFSSIELGDLQSNRFELIEWKKDQFDLYSVNYISFQALSFTNTNMPLVTPVQLSCGKCSRNVTIKHPGNSLHCICPHCQGWNQISAGKNLVFKNRIYTFFSPDLPLNSKGIINGIAYEIIGVVDKNEAGSIETFWREYTLFNSQEGFAYLSEYNGHWTYLKEVKLGLAWPEYKDDLELDGQRFELFNKYGFNTKAAVGEFISPVSGADMQIREYIAPPFMYSAEYSPGKDITWFKGEYISNTEVFKAFGLANNPMPVVSGIGPLQTQPFHVNLRFLSRMSVAAVLIFFAVQVYYSTTSAQEIVYSNKFILPDSLLSKGINTNSFELKPASSNLSFIISSPVSNNWFEAAVTMVNDKTGSEYNFEKGVEYYAGYSDGESWKEGGTETEVLLSSVPAGNYHLNIFPSFGNRADIQEFTFVVMNDVPMWRNFIIIILLLIIYPAIMWWRNRSFENKRWNNSAYNPYQKDDEDD